MGRAGPLVILFSLGFGVVSALFPPGLGFGLLGPGCAFAGPLLDAFRDSLSYNPAIKAQRSALKAAQEGVVQARSAFQPVVSAQGSLTIYDHLYGKDGISPAVSPPPSNRKGFDGSYTAGVSASMNVFNGWQSWNGYRAAREAVEAQRMALVDTQQSVLLQAAQAHYGVWYARAAAKFYESQANLALSRYQVTQNLLQAGLATRADLAGASANDHAARAALIQAKSELLASESRYRMVVGRAPGPSIGDPVDITALIPESEGVALSRALAGNASLVASLHQQRSALARVRANRGALYPSVDLHASYQYFGRRPYDSGGSAVGSVFGNVSLPLYVGGANLSKIRQAKDVFERMRYDAEQIRQKIRADVRTLWQQRKADQSLVASYKDAVSAAQAALSSVDESYKAGASTFTDVLRAQTSLLSAQIGLIKAQRAVCIAGLSLLRVMGDLELKNLIRLECDGK